METSHQPFSCECVTGLRIKKKDRKSGAKERKQWRRNQIHALISEGKGSQLPTTLEKS